MRCLKCGTKISDLKCSKCGYNIKSEKICLVSPFAAKTSGSITRFVKTIENKDEESKKQEEAKKQAEKQAKKEEEAARKRAEEQAKKEEEAARKRAEEQAKKEEEAARKRNEKRQKEEQERRKAEATRIRRNDRLYSFIKVNIWIIVLLTVLYIWKNSNFYQMIWGGVGIAALCVISVLYAITFYITNADMRWYEIPLSSLGIAPGPALLIVYVDNLIAKEDVWFTGTIIMFPISVVIALTTSTLLYSRLIVTQGDSEKQRKRWYIIITAAVGITFAVFAAMATINAINGFYSMQSGDSVEFGLFEQDGDPSNGKEQISWTVISIDGGRALLLSDVCLYAMPYNSERIDNSWTNSSIREWLNNDFYQSAFSPEEQSVIIDAEITTARLSEDEGHTYGETYGESESTNDKVFVPDLSEFWMLTTELNVSTVAKGVFSANNATYGGENYRTMFWTRSPYGESRNFACGYIAEKEEGMGYVCYPDFYAMIRPALYVDVDALNEMMRNANN